MKKIDIDNLDYKELGLCCGIELHQQLNTHKLFCNCKSKLINESTKPDKTISRRLRAVSSEAGELDSTAKEEQNKNKLFVYNFYNSCNCLVETDSQPPFPVNNEALKIAGVITKLTNSVFVDRSYVMRKQVVDGSNVSGFQRTALISTNGSLDFDFGKVRVDKILLEEDAARAIERTDDKVIYSLDRLGIPLIELVVWHDIHTPEDTKTVALKVGQIFRSTGKTKRGLGSIRQDINISIKRGSRVEVKGAQNLDLIPEIVKREIVRQLSLLEIKEELLKRAVKKISLDTKKITCLFSKTESKVIKNSFNLKKEIFAFRLENFKDLLGYEIQPDRRLGTEIASVLKATTTLKGIFHLDELPNYGITKEDIVNIKKEINLKENDSFIMVMCFADEIEDVKRIIEKRLNQLLVGVPKETRMATVEGNTEYQRPLSGSARMYPETDLGAIEFSPNYLKEVNNSLPLTIKEREKLYLEKFKLNSQLVDKMKLSNFAPVFENIVSNSKISPTTVCVFLLEDLIKAQRDNLIDLDDVLYSDLINFFLDKDFNKVPKQKLLECFVYSFNNNVKIDKALLDLGFLEQSTDLSKVVDLVIEDNKQKILELKERSVGLLMGRVMSETKGLVDGKVISRMVSEKLKTFLKNNNV
ncbi:MAG: Glu-tRNA(Gln) amidotransferase subunit GatE [Candidatus ainarchaeum sp.]|nr:Glu-tRNA(Gln) amidotransferase subunit GatE [Candidatus ainarchaeum sp.]